MSKRACGPLSFIKDEKGVISIEVAFALPALVIAFVTMLSIFDLYRSHALSQKAAILIGDISSRQTEQFDAPLLAGFQDLLAELTRSSSDETGVRVTVLNYDANLDQLNLNWSQTVGEAEAHTAQSAARELGAEIAATQDNEVVIVVETFVAHDPIFEVGFSPSTIEHLVVTRPKFAPQALWNGA